MDLDPIIWVIIIFAATAISGGLMLWGSKTKKKR